MGNWFINVVEQSSAETWDCERGKQMGLRANEARNFLGQNDKLKLSDM